MKESFENDFFIHVNHIRAIITKFRINAHRLRINSGVYENNGGPIPTGERICKFCNHNVIENESHFAFECEKYKDKRTKFIENISTFYKQFQSLTIKEQTLYIFNNKIVDAFYIIGKYLHEIYNERSHCH